MKRRFLFLLWFSQVLVSGCAFPPANSVTVRLQIASTPYPPQLSWPSWVRSPNTALEHDCFVLSVSGTGIPSDLDEMDLPDDLDPDCLQMGRISLPATQTELMATGIGVTVPAGLGRTIELIGVDGDGGSCTGVETWLNASDTDLNVLGGTVRDLVKNTAVVLNNLYDPGDPVEITEGCFDDAPITRWEFVDTGEIQGLNYLGTSPPFRFSFIQPPDGDDSSLWLASLEAGGATTPTVYVQKMQEGVWTAVEESSSSTDGIDFTDPLSTSGLGVGHFGGIPLVAFDLGASNVSGYAWDTQNSDWNPVGAPVVSDVLVSSALVEADGELFFVGLTQGIERFLRVKQLSSGSWLSIDSSPPALDNGNLLDAEPGIDASEFSAVETDEDDLLVFWTEENSSGDSLLRASRYDFSDWLQLNGSPGVSTLTANPSISPSAVVHDDKVYVAYLLQDTYYRVRVDVLDVSGTLVPVDGSTGHEDVGLNLTNGGAISVALGSHRDYLYAAWVETDNTLQVYRYNNDDTSPAWEKAFDEPLGTNFDQTGPFRAVTKVGFIESDGELFLTFLEKNIALVDQIRVKVGF